MRPPSAGIEDYLKALNKKPEEKKVPVVPQMQQLIQAEMQKLQQMQMQKNQLQQQIQGIDFQMMKTQGGLEVLKRMAGMS